MSKAAAWAALALDLVYPRACESCGGRPDGSVDGLTCAGCAPRAEWISGEACRRCGAERAGPGGEASPPSRAGPEGCAPLASRAGPEGCASLAFRAGPEGCASLTFRAGPRCSECGGRSYPFRGAVAAGRYAGFVRELVHRLKFGGRTDLARPLARRMAERVRAARWGADVGTVVPVPMRRLKLLFERGYNPAELLADRLAGELGRPARRWLAQVRPTPSQTSLTGAERRRNPRGAYAARRARGVVLLVDDVLTTGATASECSRVLLAAGASRVYLAVVGR